MRAIHEGHFTGVLKPEWVAALDELSEISFAFYRKHILENEDVVTYFEQSTPVGELEGAKIGSRPARGARRRGTSATCGRFPGYSDGRSRGCWCRRGSAWGMR